jgi:hypothetical protein
MQNNEDLQLLVSELKTLVANLQLQINNLKSQERRLENLESCPEIRKEWIPHEQLKNFLGYGDTQMYNITKKYQIAHTYIGKKKYYAASSVKQILDRNRQN